ncbi:MAG: hypothetical protein U1E78_10405 [Gammaproteobacteria bacterium]
MIFRVGAERSRRRSVHKVHDCGENREGNNPENSSVVNLSSEFLKAGLLCNDVIPHSDKRTKCAA